MTLVADLHHLRVELGELEERQAGAWTESDARTWRERGPVEFGTERLRSTYWSRQREIAEAVWRCPRVAVRSANSMGKNFVAADLMAWWVFAVGGTIITMAPTDRQLAIGMRELRRALRDSGLPYELYHRALRVGGQDRVIAMTSNSADSLRGFHDPAGLLVVIDEGQGQSVEAVAYDAAFSCATGEQDRILVLGNPARPGSRFHDISRSASWHSIKITAFEHPNIREGRVVIAGGPAPNWPETIATEYGRDSAFYTAFVDAEFPTEGTADSLVRPGDVEAAFARHDVGCSLEGWPLPVVALDVARSDAGDLNVSAIAQGPVVHRFHKWHSRDLVETAGRFLEVADDAKREWYTRTGVRAVRTTPPVTYFDLFVDTPGVGSGVVDDLRRRGRKVHEFWGWNPAKDAKRFANLRASTHWNLRTLLEDGEAVLPRDADLAEELLAMEWSLDGQGRIIVLAKDDLRRVLRRSPDTGDACVMALAASTGLLRWRAQGIYRKLAG